MAASTSESAPSIRNIAFDDLPGEIRNEIYRLAIVTKFPINITRKNTTLHQDQTISLSPGKRRTTQWKPKVTINISEGRRKRVRPVKQVLNISLLQVSKAINHEASQILFGENFFVFMTVPAVEVFCSAIGMSKTCLRSVQLDFNFLAKQDFRHFSSLSCMSKPNRIVVAPDGYSCTVASPNKTWTMIKKIVMRKAVEVRDEKGSPCLRSRATTTDEQAERLRAFDFDVSGRCKLSVGNRKLEEIRHEAELQRRLTAGVWTCWRAGVEKAEAKKREAKKAKAGAKANGSSVEERLT